MHSIGTLVFFAACFGMGLCGTVHGGWFTDAVSGRSLDLGNGLEVQLNSNGKKNASFLEGHELKFGYEGVGVSFGKALGADQLQIGLYADDEDKTSSRASAGGFGGNKKSKKMGEVLLPAAVGATMSGSIAIMLAAVTVLTLKALALAKLALVIAIGFLFAKFMSNYQSSETGKEYDFHPGVPIMADHTGFGTGYTPSASGNYLAYANYVPGQDASMDLSGQYSTNSVQALQDTSNASAAPASQTHTTGVKRRDVVRPKIMPVVTIKKYTYLK